MTTDPRAIIAHLDRITPHGPIPNIAVGKRDIGGPPAYAPRHASQVWGPEPFERFLIANRTDRLRPFVARGDRLERIDRGHQEGRRRARPDDNPADRYHALILDHSQCSPQFVELWERADRKSRR